MARNWGLRPLLLSLGLLTLMAAPAAHAQTAPATSPPPEDAKKIYDDAVSFYALGRYAEAAPLFERAFEIKHVPALLYNAAQAHRFAGHKTRALALYESYLRLYGDEERKAEIQALIAQLKSDLAAHPEAPSTGEAASTPPPAPAQTSQPTPPPPGQTATATASQPSAATLTASAPPKKTPLVKKPWFWAAVAGGAVVVAGVVVGIVVGTRGHSSPPASFGTVDGN